MRYLSLIELPRLAAFQKAALATYGERWSELRRSTAAVNRDEAEAGVLSAYAAAGLAPPRQIIWGTSPREIANLWVAAVDAGGENVSPGAQEDGTAKTALLRDADAAGAVEGEIG